MITDLDMAFAIQRCYDNPHVSYNGVESRIEYTQHCQIVATRGTTNFGDWLNNIRAMPFPVYGLGWVHYGFYRAAKKSFHQVAKWLDKSKPVYFGGHSKGGPESILYAYFAHKAGFTVARSITLGAPQFISSGKGLKHLPIVQYRNGGDSVPLLPSQRLRVLNHARKWTHIGDVEAETNWDKFHAIKFYIQELKNSGCWK